MATAIQETLFGPAEETYLHTGPPEPNPCRRLYGPGPEGKTCKRCAHLYHRVCGRKYIKCRKRQETRGPGSDHRAGWLACAKYQEAP